MQKVNKKKKYMTLDSAWAFANSLGLEHPPNKGKEYDISFSIFPQDYFKFFGKDEFGHYTYELNPKKYAFKEKKTLLKKFIN